MEVDDAIKKRRSIKKYLDVPLDWDMIGDILEAGRLAPSAGNLQPWKFIVVIDPENRKRLSEACFQQYWMQTAPVHIIICAEFNKMTRFYGLRGERLYSIQSCALAAQNMIMQATNLGLGSCFVSAFDEEMIKTHFKIPEFARPQAVITLGYVAEKVPFPPKYSLNDVVHLERFGNRIADVWKYLGYSMGKTIQKTVEGGIKAINKVADKGVGVIGKKISKKKSDEHHGRDFRYRT